MKMIHDFDEKECIYPKPVLTIGKFDGVHLGHLELISTVLKEAAEINGTSSVLTFEPHPKKVLLPHERLELLTTPRQKNELLEKTGLDLLFVQKFSSAFSIRGPEEFVKETLVKRIGISTLVLGTDFSFGKGAVGDHNLMKKFGERFDFRVVLVPPVMLGNRLVSSTYVRDMIRKGRMDRASEFLGRHYFIDGEVIRGEGRGREMHVPTANILTENELIPPQGVYATFIDLQGDKFESVTNIGVRPTFGGSYLSIETNLIGVDRDLYGQYIRLHFVERLRDEKKFPTMDLLRRQIQKDIERAMKILHCER